MILKRIILENFRAYKRIEIPFTDGINILIGKNDIGKSTILEALDIFFGQSRIKIDIDDRCIHSSGNMAITVFLEIDKEKEYLIDSDIRTNLEEEYLLNIDGQLEIRKEWDCSKDKLTATSLKTYIKANYPSDFTSTPLPILKITELKKILENVDNKDIAFALHDKINNSELEGIEIGPYSSDTDKKIPIEIDKRKRADIRRAIYSVLDDPFLQEVQIPMDKEDGKNILQALENDFPQFELFQSDRENKDSEKDVQDPLKIITRKVIKEQQEVLDRISFELEQKVEEISNQTLDKLREMNPELANELRAELHSKDWASLFNYSFTSDSGIALNKRGSGIRRLVLLNFFRAEAENRNTLSNNTIYALEEPETSQHADYQRMIMQSFKDIAEKSNHQVLLTTHSNNLVRMVKPSEVIFIKKGDSQPEIVGSENLNLEIAKDLGTLPSLNSNVVILVEGITDKYFLEIINENIEEYKQIIDLKKRQIPLFWIGGSNVTNWVESRPLQNQNIVEFHIYDSDGNDHYQNEIDIINNWGNDSCAVQTRLATIENYIHPDLVFEGKRDEKLRAYFNGNLNNVKRNLEEKWDENKWDELKGNWTTTNDIPRELKALGLSKVKNYLNEYLAKDITKEHLDNLGVFDEIKSWFEQIKELDTKYN